MHDTSRMVSSAKILAPVITNNACRDQLLISLDDIVASVDNFKNHAVAHKTAEKATDSVMGAIADLVTYLKDSQDDPIMLARDDIVAACDEVLASKTAREAVKGVRNVGEKVKVMISILKEQASETEDPDLQVRGTTRKILNKLDNKCTIIEFILFAVLHASSHQSVGRSDKNADRGHQELRPEPQQS